MIVTPTGETCGLELVDLGSKSSLVGSVRRKNIAPSAVDPSSMTFLKTGVAG